MKKIANTIVLTAMLFFTTIAAMAQTTKSDNSKSGSKMKTYLIERDIPDAGKLTPEQLKAISQKSCSVLTEMGPKIEWI